MPARDILLVSFRKTVSKRDSDTLSVWSDFRTWQQKNPSVIVLDMLLCVTVNEKELTVVYTAAVF